MKPVALKVTKTKRVPSRIGDMDGEVFKTLTRLKHRNLVCPIVRLLWSCIFAEHVSFAGRILQLLPNERADVCFNANVPWP